MGIGEPEERMQMFDFRGAARDYKAQVGESAYATELKFRLHLTRANLLRRTILALAKRHNEFCESQVATLERERVELENSAAYKLQQVRERLAAHHTNNVESGSLRNLQVDRDALCSRSDSDGDENV